jgi:hypothetical protein
LQKVRSINWHDLHNKLTKTDDVIAVLLGFDAPVILRPKANGHLEFVGEAYVHGLMNGDATLGPLPFGWQAQADRNQHGLMVQTFTQISGVAVEEDPRLEHQLANHEGSDETDKPNHDTRLLPGALKTRGVATQTFQIC